MIAARYKTKKELKESIGQKFKYQETSIHGPEWRANEMLTVVGPSPYDRKWCANVWVSTDNTIMRVK